METSRIAEMGFTGLAEALERGEVTSEEAMEDYLGRIRLQEKTLNALTWVDEEGAMKAARAADAARRAGDRRRWLGVPIGIKDLLNVEGQPCTAGSRILEGYRAPYDATVIRRLREEGAIFPVRTNTDEFAMGGSTETSWYGPTRNPWNPDRVPGGSSGGSAAAVAAGLVPAALASDTGGSIRQPAAFCGVTGLKPTYGRVSRYGCVAFASSLDQIGPMGRNVEDVAAVYETIAGFDEHDSTSSRREVGMSWSDLKHVGDLKGVRLGVPEDYFESGLSPDVRKLTLEAIETCRELGAQIEHVRLPHSRYGIACYYILAPAEASANLARYDGVRYGFRGNGSSLQEMYETTRAEGFGAEVKRRIMLGTYVLSSGFYDAYYRRAQKVRQLIREDFARAFEHCDALIGPVTPTTAFGLGEKTQDPIQMYLGDIFTVNVNLAGICALSLPCGFDHEGLPSGLHVIGPAWSEKQILSIGAAYQHATNWHRMWPGMNHC